MNFNVELFGIIICQRMGKRGLYKGKIKDKVEKEQ
jgi:hypothetical protein